MSSVEDGASDFQEEFLPATVVWPRPFARSARATPGSGSGAPSETRTLVSSVSRQFRAARRGRTGSAASASSMPLFAVLSSRSSPTLSLDANASVAARFGRMAFAYASLSEWASLDWVVPRSSAIRVARYQRTAGPNSRASRVGQAKSQTQARRHEPGQHAQSVCRRVHRSSIPQWNSYAPHELLSAPTLPRHPNNLSHASTH